MAPPRQCLARMAADITGALRNKYFHGTPPWHPSNRLQLSYHYLTFLLRLSYLFFAFRTILISTSNQSKLSEITLSAASRCNWKHSRTIHKVLDRDEDPS